MLSRTFCHLPGVGVATEKKLWKAGICTWQDLVDEGAGLIPASRRSMALEAAALSMDRLDSGDAEWFAQRLPPAESWRLYSHFAHAPAYVDIETTGTYRGEDHITAIAYYDGETVRTYVHGENLEAFADDIRDAKLLVTFNGKCFDVPILERELQITLPQAHVDLRFVLKKVGIHGGLKRCEHALGLSRGELDGVDGFFAVLLWQEYLNYADPAALETLLAYNVEDVLSLEILLAHAVNARLAETPFAGQIAAEARVPAANPHCPDADVIRRIRSRYGI